MADITKYLPEKVNRLEEYKPNEAIYPIRMDANESPYLPSEAMLSKFADVTKGILYNRYPDPKAGALINAFSKIYNVNPDCVAAGNGSDELISILYGSFMAKGDKVMMLAPDFSMYSFYDGISETELVKYPKADDRFIDFDAAAKTAIEQQVKLVIFSNPCNPTGVVYDRETIVKFIKALPCICVVDEAYMDFSPVDYSVLDLCDTEGFDNLIVLKTLSKIGLAALRVGFAVASKEMAAAVRKVKSPYNVNSLSQALAQTALSDFGEFAAHITEVKANVLALYEAVKPYEEKAGFTVLTPGANFVTLYFTDGAKAKAIFEGLASKGVIVRYTCGRCLRVTCGTAGENAVFLKEFGGLV